MAVSSGCGWRLVAAGGWWQLAVGGWWLLAVGGGWWLAVDGPLGWSLRAVLNKKKKLGPKGLPWLRGRKGHAEWIFQTKLQCGRSCGVVMYIANAIDLVEIFGASHTHSHSLKDFELVWPKKCQHTAPPRPPHPPRPPKTRRETYAPRAPRCAPRVRFYQPFPAFFTGWQGRGGLRGKHTTTEASTPSSSPMVVVAAHTPCHGRAVGRGRRGCRTLRYSRSTEEPSAPQGAQACGAVSNVSRFAVLNALVSRFGALLLGVPKPRK